MNSVAACSACAQLNPPAAKFCNKCGTHLNAPKEPAIAALERRQLTVLFCDLAGSTILVERLDPELARSIIRRFQALSKSIIEALGGRITEYLGDGIVAQFTHHESNAERAVNAALQVVRDLAAESIDMGDSGKKAAVRCGVATGLAVVGDILDDGRIKSEAAIGLPLNLAARLQSVAQVSEVVVGKTTHDQISGLFELEHLGEFNLKGISTAQPAWRVLAQRSISSRFVAHAAKLTPMVDRVEIVNELMEGWNQAKNQHGCAMHCIGEAGIGKSRIITEMAARIAKDSHFKLEYQCAPYHTNTAFYPIIQGIEASAGFEHKDNNARRVRKLGTLIKTLNRFSPGYENDTEMYCNLLSLSSGSSHFAPKLDPDELKELLLLALVGTMTTLAKKRPVFLTIEDLHWSDPTTIELFERLIQALSKHPVFVLLTSRPSPNPAFADNPKVKPIFVKRLSEPDVHIFANQILDETQFSSEMITQIIKRSEGNALFIEELSKNAIENTLERAKAHNTLPLADSAIPETLQELLMERLDRLPKETNMAARLAAVIGRDFNFDLLELLGDYKDKNLYRILTPLLEAQLVVQQQAPPNAKFSFRHALVRDAVYENLLRSDRATVHKRIVEIMEEHYPNECELAPELLAQHAENGNEPNKAAGYWLNAGKKSNRKYALKEARQQLLNAKRTIELMPESTEHMIQLLEVLVSLGPVLIALEGSGSEKTRDNYQKAVDLCENLSRLDSHWNDAQAAVQTSSPSGQHSNPAPLQFMALWGQWLASKDHEEDHGLVWATLLKQQSDKAGDVGQQLQAEHCMWITQFHLGNFKTAQSHIETGIKHYDPTQHSHHASVFGGHDPKVCGSGFLAHAQWFQGDDQAALTSAASCYAGAKKLKHKGSILHAIHLNMLLQLYRRDPQGINKWRQKLVRFCADMNLPEYAGMLLHSEGLLLSLSGNFERGIEMMKEGFSQIVKVGTAEDLALYGEITADCYLNEQKYTEGLHYIDQVFDRLNHHKVQYWRAEVLRCKARLQMHLGLHDLALDGLLDAYQTAHRQDAKMLQLRAAISLFKLNQETTLYPEAAATLLQALNRLQKHATSTDQETARRLLQSD